MKQRYLEPGLFQNHIGVIVIKNCITERIVADPDAMPEQPGNLSLKWHN